MFSKNKVFWSFSLIEEIQTLILPMFLDNYRFNFFNNLIKIEILFFIHFKIREKNKMILF